MPGALTPDPRVAELLGFWFGDEPDDALVAQRQRALWFEQHPGHDREIAARFTALLDDAEAGGLRDWRAEPRPGLARVIVLDQLSRVIGRGTARAYRNDPEALQSSREWLDTDAEHALRPIERVFLYLPLEHAEDLALQRESVTRCEVLARSVPRAWRGVFEDFAEHARRHEAVVRRFGRFPHRNAVLGRASSADEIEFLRDASGFF